MDLVSVIIPVHNMEQTLARCLSSVEKQSYRNLEIIVIDDGSKDDSYKVATNCQAKDPRIIILQQSQQGVSTARNRGIAESHGNFIAFIDADDTINVDFISKLVRACKNTGSDVGVCNVIYRYKHHDERPLCISNQQTLNREKYLDELLYNLKGFVANKIFTKRIIGNTRFQKDIAICEDFVFTIEIAKKIQSAAIVNEHLYNYHQDAPSATHTMNTKHLLSEIDALATISELIANEQAKTRRDYNFEFAITMHRRHYECISKTSDERIAKIINSKYKVFLQKAKQAHTLTIKQYLKLFLYKNFYPVIVYLRKTKHNIGEH